jgi:hypothetical protein
MRLTRKDKETIITRIMDDTPSIDYCEQARVYLHDFYLKRCSPVIQQILADKTIACHIKNTYKYVQYPINTIAVPGYHDGALPPKAQQMMDDLNELLPEQNVQRLALKKSLETAFAGVNTRKAALQLFPEFEKYLPEEDSALKNLPTVTGVMSALVQMGWPKDQKPAAKTTKAPRNKAA